MFNQWSLLKDVKWTASSTLEAGVCVPRDCIWFAGHFPGEPILPGIALINTVYEAIQREAQNRGESVRISSLKRIRFTGPVRPGESFCLSMTTEEVKEERLFNFKVAVKDAIVCSGLVSVIKT